MISPEAESQQNPVELQISTTKEVGEKKKDSLLKNVGFVNYKWTEILVENEEKCKEKAREEVKEAIIQITKREENNPLDEWTDKYIRLNHKKFVPVEVQKDRNGRIIYTAIKPSAKPEISLGAEVRTPQVSDNKEQSDRSTINDLTEVEYPTKKEG